MTRAVGALSKDADYKDKITTEIVMMGSEKGKASDAKYAWGDEKHGLVVLDPNADNKVVGQINGHSYGMTEDGALERLKALIAPLLN